MSRRAVVLAVSREARELALDTMSHGGRAALLAALGMVAASTLVRLLLVGTTEPGEGAA